MSCLRCLPRVEGCNLLTGYDLQSSPRNVVLPRHLQLKALHDDGKTAWAFYRRCPFPSFRLSRRYVQSFHAYRQQTSYLVCSCACCKHSAICWVLTRNFRSTICRTEREREKVYLLAKKHHNNKHTRWITYCLSACQKGHSPSCWSLIMDDNILCSYSLIAIKQNRDDST